MKKLGIILMAFAVVLGLAACGGKDEESKGSTKDGAIELTLWTDWTEDRPENTLSKDIIAKFNEEHEDVQVKIEEIPHDQYETKLRTQAAGNQLPDLMRVWPGARTAPLAEGGAILPLNPIIDNWDGVIPDSILQNYAIDGNYYAIPANVSITSLIYYNKEMLKEVGFDEFPATYSEFKELVKALDEKGTTPIALGNKAIWPLQSVYISTIADRFTGSDFLNSALNGDASFEDPQFIKALSVIDELTKMNAFNEDMNTLDEAQSRNEFIKGTSAMHFAGSWAIGPILEAVEDADNIGVAPFPTFEGGNGDAATISGVAGGGIAVSSQLSEEEQEAAFTFLKYYYGEELYKGLVKANIIVPAEVEMDDSIPQIFKDANSQVKGGLAPVYDATLTPELTDIINNGLQSITLGDKTPEQLAKEMQKENESK
ncbi:extracellular solute-binding protein [Bacillus sp. REN16]|uniref:extracellular solute-binding protein n=1 Tax=Bacillus sp. REN16 TaxID=2887296 RepID=UPI001E487C72|nr:extracellular solute-binding protein [Bacillus sp. REN16]MCC3356868.1 extracellular solute-binding protein [Bacillus sp. REN16]